MATLDDFVSFLQGASNSAASNLSAPVDGINWLLGKAGLPVSKTPVGGSDWLRQAGFTAEPKNRNAGLLGESVGGVMPIVAAAKAPQIAAGLNQAGRNLAAPRTLNPETGAIVWHGSPHKFDKFDSSKIGTGEGAQAYGHGLYLAESPKVATEYSKMGSGAGGPIPSPLRFVNGQEVQPGTGSYKAASLLDSMSVAQAKKTVNGWLKSARPEEVAYFQEVSDTLAGIGSKSAVKQKAPGGSLYKVDLPDEQIARMLDWDKPLSQQSKEVQRAIAKTKTMLPPNAMDDLGGDLSLMYGPDVTPKDFLNTWESFGQKAGGEEALKKLGVPGVRYLDGGSRGAGQGTSNFVVFPGNEGLLSILERNGQTLR